MRGPKHKTRFYKTDLQLLQGGAIIIQEVKRIIFNTVGSILKEHFQPEILHSLESDSLMVMVCFSSTDHLKRFVTCIYQNSIY